MKLSKLERVVRDRLRDQLREINALVGSAEACLEDHDYGQVSARIDLIQRACSTTEFERRIYDVTTSEKQCTQAKLNDAPKTGEPT